MIFDIAILSVPTFFSVVFLIMLIKDEYSK